MSIFSFFKKPDPKLEQYKTALAMSEKECKRLFASVCSLQAKLRTSEYENMRLQKRMKDVEKWKIILENGEKDVTMGQINK